MWTEISTWFSVVFKPLYIHQVYTSFLFYSSDFLLLYLAGWGWHIALDSLLVLPFNTTADVIDFSTACSAVRYDVSRTVTEIYQSSFSFLFLGINQWWLVVEIFFLFLFIGDGNMHFMFCFFITARSLCPWLEFAQSSFSLVLMHIFFVQIYKTGACECEYIF